MTTWKPRPTREQTRERARARANATGQAMVMVKLRNGWWSIRSIRAAQPLPGMTREPGEIIRPGTEGEGERFPPLSKTIPHANKLEKEQAE